MELTINHKKRYFDNLPSTLETLMQLEAFGKSQGIAVAINNRVVPKTDWIHTTLQDKDVILIITATQGG
ncbi:sulfur carrier protein ThiS [Elizabethkingia argentiflava]|uniref:Sulfur carrier protein ThiS n=1 Tax=Elizabethkingia argenteiflava TaxID=2681556 RepID=A0A845PV49_9FLAO|nr:sulfur carrier protein ThiS [Elizabethkingia argenteiflava]NAW50168.1 sulfur carrier protein ThiS [Elizabethkingia argenteiflava]